MDSVLDLIENRKWKVKSAALITFYFPLSILLP